MLHRGCKNVSSYRFVTFSIFFPNFFFLLSICLVIVFHSVLVARRETQGPRGSKRRTNNARERNDRNAAIQRREKHSITTERWCSFLYHRGSKRVALIILLNGVLEQHLHRSLSSSTRMHRHLCPSSRCVGDDYDSFPRPCNQPISRNVLDRFES